MTDKLKQAIIAAGLTITAFAGGYFVAEPGVETKEVITYKWEEKEVLVGLWNQMIELKKIDCETEKDCEIIEGKPMITFEDITPESIPAKLNEKLEDYEITLSKKVELVK